MAETRATLRYSGTSATKVRQVLALIRGLDVTEARERLRFVERAAAAPVAKLLDSAVANAEHNDNLSSDELYVARCWADEGPTMKRYRPRARGRATRIRKRMSHVTIVVARYRDEELRARAAREAATGGAGERRRRALRRRRVAASTPAPAPEAAASGRPEAPAVGEAPEHGPDVEEPPAAADTRADTTSEPDEGGQ